VGRGKSEGGKRGSCSNRNPVRGKGGESWNAGKTQKKGGDAQKIRNKREGGGQRKAKAVRVEGRKIK